jgi:hypothetical protein
MNDPASPLPPTGYVRLHQLIGDPGKGLPGIIPMSKSTLLRLVRNGQFPAPVKLSPMISAWRVEDIREWLNSLGKQDPT